MTPGELLLEEFCAPWASRGIGEIVAGRRFCGLSNGYWLRAQAAYDTEVAQESLAAALDRIKPWSETARRAVAGPHRIFLGGSGDGPSRMRA